MIDPHKTGAYIARLRKERDWTQLELADKLHVTHQAVSRWEIGDSFPDLGTLAQLAHVFGVRMESLLDGLESNITVETARDKVLVELAEGHAERVAELAKADPSDIDTVIESGPMTRPSLMNRIIQNMSGYPFSLEQVVGLAPFVGAELLDSLVVGLGEKLDIHALLGLAPHMSGPELSRLVRQMEGTMDIKHVIGLAPFIDQEVLDELMGRVTRDKIEGYQVISLAPFVSQAVLDKLVERLPEKELDIDQVTALAPFVDSQVLKQLVEHLPATVMDAPTIVALSPFLDRQTLESLIRGQKQNPPAQG